MDMPWVSEYVRLEDRYLPEEDYERVRENVPTACPTCGGTGSYDAEGQSGVVCQCRRQEALFKHYLAAGIGELYMRLDWPDYVSDPATLEKVVKYLRRWDGFLREGIGLTLSGGYGIGKTMLVALTAKEFVKLGQRVFFTTYAQMIEMFAAGWRSTDDQRWFEEKIISTKVLVIDDIGKEMQTKLAESTFDHVMRQRAVALRPTLLTTNLTEDTIDRRYGGGALSILFERSMLVNVPEGTDFRKQARKRASQQVTEGWRRPIT